MIKGGTLKDDDWGKLALREGMSFMVLGTAGELPKPPEKKIVFLEGSVVDHCLHPQGLVELNRVVCLRCRYGRRRIS